MNDDNKEIKSFSDLIDNDIKITNLDTLVSSSVSKTLI